MLKLFQGIKQCQNPSESWLKKYIAFKSITVKIHVYNPPHPTLHMSCIHHHMLLHVSSCASCVSSVTCVVGGVVVCGVGRVHCRTRCGREELVSDIKKRERARDTHRLRTGGGTCQDIQQERPVNGTHFLKTTEGEAGQDTERRGTSEGYSLWSSEDSLVCCHVRRRTHCTCVVACVVACNIALSSCPRWTCRCVRRWTCRRVRRWTCRRVHWGTCHHACRGIPHASLVAPVVARGMSWGGTSEGIEKESE